MPQANTPKYARQARPSRQSLEHSHAHRMDHNGSSRKEWVMPRW